MYFAFMTLQKCALRGCQKHIFQNQFLDLYDVVLLQEVFTSILFSSKRDRLVSCAKSYGYNVVQSPNPWLTGKLADSGLLILSRWNIMSLMEEKFSQRFSLGVDADAQLELGVLDGSRLELGSALCIVKAVHNAEGEDAIKVLVAVVRSQ